MTIYTYTPMFPGLHKIAAAPPNCEAAASISLYLCDSLSYSKHNKLSVLKNGKHYKFIHPCKNATITPANTVITKVTTPVIIFPFIPASTPNLIILA